MVVSGSETLSDCTEVVRVTYNMDEDEVGKRFRHRIENMEDKDDQSKKEGVNPDWILNREKKIK